MIDENVVWKIIDPYSAEKIAELEQINVNLVHYTTSNALFGIIDSEEFWLRNAKLMDDYSETNHGLMLLYRYVEQHDNPLMTIVDKVYPNTSSIIRRYIDMFLLNDNSTNIFIGCLSEHKSAEDSYGRLSMWRAYCGAAGVAVVLNNTAFQTAGDSLGAYTTPVRYCDFTELTGYLGKVCSNIDSSLDLLRSLSDDDFHGYLRQLINTIVFASKHPSFYEELEWRIIYLPDLNNSSKPRIRSKVVHLNNIPQIVQALPLKNAPELDLRGANINELIKKIIIGPCKYPFAVKAAICEKLKGSGFTDPEAIVSFSGIPLHPRAQ